MIKGLKSLVSSVQTAHLLGRIQELLGARERLDRGRSRPLACQRDSNDKINRLQG